MKSMMKSQSSEQGLTQHNSADQQARKLPCPLLDLLAQMSGISQAIHPFYWEKD